MSCATKNMSHSPIRERCAETSDSAASSFSTRKVVCVGRHRQQPPQVLRAMPPILHSLADDILLLLIDHGASPFTLSCTSSALRRQLLGYVENRRHVAWSDDTKITFNSTESINVCRRDKDQNVYTLTARLTKPKPYFDAHFCHSSRLTPLGLKDCISFQCIANINVMLIYAQDATKSFDNFVCAISLPDPVFDSLYNTLNVSSPWC